MSEITLPVTNIQRFSTQDGPGVRTTVFLKGCPLRCIWCHNPETQSTEPQVFFTKQNCINCGKCNGIKPPSLEGGLNCLAYANICPSGAIEPAQKYMTADEIMAVIHKDAAFYGAQGGVTLSGGEPLLHMDGCLEILRQAKQAGYSTVIETSGYFDPKHLDKLIAATDLFLWDFKIWDAALHAKLTGVSNEKILQNLACADKKGASIILRCIMIKGVNMNDAHFMSIKNLRRSLKNCIGLELIPYHPGGGTKNKRLGYKDNGNMNWIPTNEDMANAASAVYGGNF